MPSLIPHRKQSKKRKAVRAARKTATRTGAKAARTGVTLWVLAKARKTVTALAGVGALLGAGVLVGRKLRSDRKDAETDTADTPAGPTGATAPPTPGGTPAGAGSGVAEEARFSTANGTPPVEAAPPSVKP
jgi:hypothetical protein